MPKRRFWAKPGGTSTAALELVYQADSDAARVGAGSDRKARIGGAGERVVCLIPILDKASRCLELGRFGQGVLEKEAQLLRIVALSRTVVQVTVHQRK